MDSNNRSNSTAARIIQAAIPILARDGYGEASIRAIAAACKLEPSVIYYHFADKVALMRAVRSQVNDQLDTGLSAMPPVDSASEMLRQRVAFNVDHAEEIVCLLQYFLALKHDFPETAGGYVPKRAYAHMYDVIQRGVAEGVYHSDDLDFDAKIVTHLINGFLLEYYPHTVRGAQRAKLVDGISRFIESSLAIASPRG